MQEERVDAKSIADAMVIRGAQITEKGFLSGVFNAINIGPREAERVNYLAMMAEVVNFESLGRFKEAAALRARAESLLEEKWKADAPNHVTTEGANLALDTFLAGSGYTVVGPFMGLISSVSYSTTAITDVAAQINGTNGWKEAGSSTNFPLYTTPRKTCAWSAAGSKSKALSAALAFPIITTGGTVKGCFIIYGTSAVSTIADTNGKLYSAGVFSGGDKIVGVGDTLNCSYSASM
jgi:hypothetical protein